MNYNLDQSIKYGPDNNYWFDNSAIDAFFLNKFKKPKKVINKQYNNYYKLNLDGFRSDEFEKNTSILFAGDSFTFGAGIPINYLWSKIVADRFNVNHINLGVPGSSVMSSVSNIFEYCRIYGNPKVISCLFPDFYRTFRIKNYHFGYDKYDFDKNIIKSFSEDNYYDDIQHISPNLNIPKFIKLPTEIQNILQPDTAYYLSMNYISMLEQYCNSSNIKLIWSTWQEENMDSINIVRSRNPERLSGVIDLEFNCWERDFDLLLDNYYSNAEKIHKVVCHETLKNEDQYIFDMGFDRENDKGDMHWGSHRHRHIADKFIDAIVKSDVF